jgi:hypothetical protein
MSSAAGPPPESQPLERDAMEDAAAGATDALISFVSGLRFDALDHEVRHYARRHLIDTVGVMIAGAGGIVFLAVGESVGAARGFAARHHYDINADQELVEIGRASCRERV